MKQAQRVDGVFTIYFHLYFIQKKTICICYNCSLDSHCKNLFFFTLVSNTAMLLNIMCMYFAGEEGVEHSAPSLSVFLCHFSCRREICAKHDKNTPVQPKTNMAERLAMMSWPNPSSRCASFNELFTLHWFLVLHGPLKAQSPPPHFFFFSCFHQKCTTGNNTLAAAMICKQVVLSKWPLRFCFPHTTLGPLTRQSRHTFATSND